MEIEVLWFKVSVQSLSRTETANTHSTAILAVAESKRMRDPCILPLTPRINTATAPFRVRGR